MAGLPNEQQGGSRRMEVFDHLLGLFPPARLVDLGAGRGGFSIRAAERGWKVTAVDARPDRFPAHPEVTWVTEDIRKFPLEDYDVIACLGLFYHLGLDDQLALLRRCSGRPLILDTHVDAGEHSHPLSDREQVGGHEGRWYREPRLLTSSWGNERSFWPTPQTLYRMLGDAGYPVVAAVAPWYLPDRTFFLALPARSRRAGHPAARVAPA